MFAGIVEDVGEIIAYEKLADFARIIVQPNLDHSETKIGDSISVDGVCLTVVDVENNTLKFELALETLNRSMLGKLNLGSHVNLERSLKLGDRISGHLVVGHVDSSVKLLKMDMEGESFRLEFELPPEFQAMIAEKGSVCLAGVSLTVTNKTANSFSVVIIPHTWKNTIISTINIGDQVNLEIDLLARYCAEAVKHLR